MLLPGIKEQITDNLKQMIINDKNGELIIDNPKFEDILGKEIKGVLDGKKTKLTENFCNYKIYIFGGNFFLLEIGDVEKRDNYKNFLDEKFKKINDLSSKKLENNRQIPENSGYFEYNGKYYIVIEAYNNLTDETDEEKGIYKGIIINPQQYFEIKNTIEKTKLKLKI